MGDEVVYVRRQDMRLEQPVALSVSPWKPLPTDEIAKLFGLWKPTVKVREVQDLGLTVSAIRRLMPDVGTARQPFHIWGYTSPFPAGFKANFVDAREQVLTALQIVRLLHISATSAVYSVVKQKDSSQEQLVLKLIFKEGVMYPSELSTLKDLAELRSSTRRTCPSLPDMVGYGWFLASGDPLVAKFGDADARLIKPLGICVKGMPNVQQQQVLCKAAFDILLALYHLYVLERRHRDVKPENIIYVQGQNQFVLVDLKRAHEEVREYPEGEVHDCIALVLSLAEMWGWKGTGGYRAAAATIAGVHPVLASFAQYATTLQSARAFPHYHHWLHQLASACGIDAAAATALLGFSGFVQQQRPVG